MKHASPIGLVLLFAAVLGCDQETAKSIGDASEDAAVSCGATTDAGERICCGRDAEIPGLSCVDLSQDGGDFGSYGHCIGEGEDIDARVAGARCCEGLVRSERYVESMESFEDFPSGCGPSGFPPNSKICLPCGNGRCDPDENRCNCAEDCDADGGD